MFLKEITGFLNTAEPLKRFVLWRSENCLFLNFLVQLKILLWTQADVSTDSVRIKIVVDEVVNDLWQVVLKHGVALRLQRWRAHHTAEAVADLFEECDDLVLRGRVCDELVNVGDDVDADAAGEVVVGLGGCEGGGDEGRDEESELHLDLFHRSVCLTSEVREVEAVFIVLSFISLWPAECDTV